MKATYTWPGFFCNSKTFSKLNRFDYTGANNTLGRGMPYLRMMTVSGSSISTFEEDACCETLPYLRNVFFHTNWLISALPEHIFRGNRGLLCIKLQRNIITKLQQNLFRDATMMFTLTMSANKITEIQPDGLPAITKQMDFAMGW